MPVGGLTRRPRTSKRPTACCSTPPCPAGGLHRVRPPAARPCPDGADDLGAAHGNDCEVLFAIAQVHARRGRWAEAAESFTARSGARKPPKPRRAQRRTRCGCAVGPPRARPSSSPRRARPRHREHPRRACDVHAATAHLLAGHADHARPLAERPWLATMGGEGHRSCSTGSQHAVSRPAPFGYKIRPM